MRLALSAWLGVLAVAIAVAIAGQTATASAQDDMTREERVAAAREAYDLATQKYRAHQWREAAELYEQADMLVPAALAATQAIRAYRRAGDDLRAATIATGLVERDVANRRHADFVPEVAEHVFKLRITCEDCTVQVDGTRERFRTLFLEPDQPHVVSATFPTGTREETLQGGAGEEREVALQAPTRQVADAGGRDGGDDGAHASGGPFGGGIDGGSGGGGRDGGGGGPSDGGGGISPIWLIIAGGLTVVAGGLSIWSGIDVLTQRSAFDTMKTIDRLNAGNDAELRTNIFYIATGGLAAVTVLLLLFTDFSGGDDAHESHRAHALRLDAAPLAEGGALATLSSSF